jgi:hypothetical protein
MSRIYFHSPSGTAEVGGRERAYAGLLCHKLFCVSLGITGRYTDHSDIERYRKILPSDCYVCSQPDERFFETLRTWMLAGFGAMFHLPNGTQANVLETTLNTAVVMGSDPIRLLAKLHGQCEIHAYVEGPNRAWLAGIVEQGIQNKVLRVWEKDFYGGWPAVVELLRSRDDEPVVTSYSATKQFPNRFIASEHGSWDATPDLEAIKQEYELTDDDDLTEYASTYKSDRWYDLPDAEQWQFAMDGLRKQNESAHLEIKPETFAQQGYGNGMSGFDIIALLYSE